MANKKKTIPILDDVVRTGHTDKAVKGGIDPYPRKLAPRKQKVEIKADASTPSDKLTEQYARTVEQQNTPAKKKADDNSDTQKTAPPPVLTETVDKKAQPAPEQDKPAAAETGDSVEYETIDVESIVDKIVDEMIPDLEQHIRLQLRFELEKHLPRSIKAPKNKDSGNDK